MTFDEKLYKLYEYGFKCKSLKEISVLVDRLDVEKTDNILLELARLYKYPYIITTKEHFFGYSFKFITEHTLEELLMEYQTKVKERRVNYFKHI